MTELTFGSLFAGIGGFDLGFERAGLRCLWQVEWDQKCQDVLRRHFTAEVNDDVRTVGKHNLKSVDVICGGFPCQDLSVAGKRAGLAGERSGLWFEFHRIIAELSPRWVVTENVPGLLSSSGGADFAVILSGLVKLGYGVTWRVLDAQYFGVPQRRRRVFIVGSLGSGRSAEVLFEREGSAWNTAPSREAGQGVAAAAVSRIGKGGFTDPVNDNIIPSIGIQPAQTGANGRGWQIEQAHTLDGSSLAVMDGRNLNDQGEISSTLQSKSNGGYSLNYQPLVAYNWQAGPGASLNFTETPNLVSSQVPAVGVRRLTPVECERLQGFPDSWTADQADSTRYRQLGNAVAVPCAEWIGRRILTND